MSSTALAIIEKTQEVIAPIRSKFESVEGLKLAYDKEVGFAVQILAGNESLASLAERNPQHIQAALYNVALTGLSLNPVLKYAYLLPRNGRIILEPSYMGFVKILTDAGSVRSVRAELVYDGDVFEVHKGTENRIVHIPNYAGSREKIIAVYAIAEIAGGLQQFEVMTAADVEKIKLRSESVRAGRNSPWRSDGGEMHRKTAIRRLFKYLPKTEISEATLNALRVFDENNQTDNANHNDPAAAIFKAKPEPTAAETAEDLKARILAGMEGKETGEEISEELLQKVAMRLESLTLGNDENQRTLLRFLFGVTSKKFLTKLRAGAFLYWAKQYQRPDGVWEFTKKTLDEYAAIIEYATAETVGTYEAGAV